MLLCLGLVRPVPRSQAVWAECRELGSSGTSLITFLKIQCNGPPWNAHSCVFHSELLDWTAFNPCVLQRELKGGHWVKHIWSDPCMYTRCHLVTFSLTSTHHTDPNGSENLAVFELLKQCPTQQTPRVVEQTVCLQFSQCSIGSIILNIIY